MRREADSGLGRESPHFTGGRCEVLGDRWRQETSLETVRNDKRVSREKERRGLYKGLGDRLSGVRERRSLARIPDFGLGLLLECDLGWR